MLVREADLDRIIAAKVEAAIAELPVVSYVEPERPQWPLPRPLPGGR